MIIGITGGIGTGKTRVLEILEEEYNARIIIADEVSKFLQAPGGRCYQSIIDEFGEDILDMSQPDHPIDRAKLAGIVFADQDRLEDLNYIVHPVVKTEIMCEISGIYHEDTEALIVIEAALLIEAGYTSFIDELWVVRADKDVRIERLVKNRGYTAEKAESVMASQMSEEEYLEEADFVIDNSGTEDELKAIIKEKMAEFE